jgi:DNA repair photolyase
MDQSEHIIAKQPASHKGRGTSSSPGNRFAPTQVEWDEGIEGPTPVTECRPVRARSIISRNNSPDIPFYQSINPYQGCEHGCIYCYARPTHAYLDMSPGLDFETKLTYKANAAQQLEIELARPSYTCQVITIGANTDPYQPVEKTHRITRKLLKVCLRHKHPVSLITKGALITRDLDLLRELAAQSLCSVAISITCLDDGLKRQLEPRAASARARFAALEKLSSAGVPTSVLFAPVIPALNDSDMEEILTRASAAGVQSASYILLRLPREVRDLFYEWLRQHHPLRGDHVISLLRQSRGGADNDTRFGHRMRGNGPFADLLQKRFTLMCRKLGLNNTERINLRTDLFEPPLTEAQAQQPDLFQ